MKILCAIAVFVLGTVDAGTAYADSDGYYCVGRGYLAYQFGFAAPPVGPHRLHVIRLDGDAPFEKPAVLDLPQFQVQGILCGERTIQLAAYDAIYTVLLDGTVRPVKYSANPLTDRGHVPSQFVGQARNLGAWNAMATTLKSERVSLGTVDGGGQYVLEISGAAVESQPCASIVTTRVVRTDRNGREVQQFEVFRGRGIRDCGGGAG
jgi:hypothetical protein